MGETIEDLVRADHERCNEKFNTLEQMAVTFERGDKIFAARVEKTQVTIRYGTINRVFYKNNEIIFNIAPSESSNADFTISSRNWDVFELESDLFDYLHTKIGEAEETDLEVVEGNETVQG